MHTFSYHMARGSFFFFFPSFFSDFFFFLSRLGELFLSLKVKRETRARGPHTFVARGVARLMEVCPRRVRTPFPFEANFDSLPSLF